MGTLQELFDLRNSSNLRNRVAAAGWRAAKIIFTEPDATSNHAARLKWAVRILQDDGDGQAVLQIFKAAIVLLENDGEAAIDEQIETAVGQVINRFASEV